MRILIRTFFPLSLLVATRLCAGTIATSNPAPSDAEQIIQDMKHPVDWLNWGGDFRLRNEYGDNFITLNGKAPLHEQDYFRLRARLWASVQPVTNLTLNARVSDESRDWMDKSYARQYGAGRTGMEWRYGVVDNLNVRVANLFGEPLTVTAGRQDVTFGDGWLVLDGTPGDGSWTLFLDSLRFTFDAKDIQTKFDVVLIQQSALPDEWLPTIGDSSAKTTDGMRTPYYLTEQDERGVILYVSNKSLKNVQLDGYFIYKNDQRVHTDILPNGDNADIYTLGGKFSGTPTEHWQYSLEGAYQFGEKQDPMVKYPVNLSTETRDISAYGGNGRLTYLFKDRFNNQASLIFEYLSGDDPKSKGTDEMFDILWGRWPRWSELYIYSYINETGKKIAQLNNLGRIGPSWSITPVKNLTFTATYNALFAPEATPTRTVNAGLYSQDGNFRGHYVQAILKYQFSKHVSAHAWSEFVFPGNFYTHNDTMMFLRGELMLTF